MGEITLLDSREWLYEEYIVREKSTTKISSELGTYTKRVVRALVKHGIPIRPKEESQAIALKSGRAKHPTKGESRPPETREKISITKREKHG